MIGTFRNRLGAELSQRSLIRALRHCLLAGGALTSLVPPAARASLVDSAVEGSVRVCVYDKQPLRLDSVRRVLTDRRAIQVGRGEPCPRSPALARPRPAVAPSLGTLQSSRRDGSDLVCIYALNGISYPVRLPRTSRCPLTPNATGIR